MRVTLDQPRCVASGQCVFAAPDIFHQDDEGTVVDLEAAPSPDRRADVEEAATLCPAAAILLE